MGEPLINKHFYEIAAAIKQAGIAEIIATTTNASLINDENARKLVESGIDQVIISFYGMNDADYKAVSRNITFDRIVKGGRNLIAARKALGSKTPFVAGKFFRADELVRSLLVDELQCVDTVAPKPRSTGAPSLPAWPAWPFRSKRPVRWKSVRPRGS